MKTIYYRHFRLTKNGKLNQQGGFTLALRRNSSAAYVGIARCSNNEKYSKEMGRTVATSRLKDSTKCLTITTTDICDFMYEHHFAPTTLTATGQKKFINTLSIDDVSTEFLFHYTLAKFYEEYKPV